MKYNLAFIGMGTVGQGLLDIIISKRNDLLRDYNVEFIVTAISDMLMGSVYDPSGIDPQELLSHIKEGKSLNDFKGESNDWDAIKTIEESNADVVVEVSYTDVNTGEPASSHLKKALECGKHVVTTNKGPLIHCYRELKELADSKNLFLGFEGTVMSGTPVFSLMNSCLQGNEITLIKGIMNGTTNYILCEMEKGLDYATALKQAQDAGFAEAIPDVDVEGLDAQAKAIILSSVVMGEKLTAADVPCNGITKISNADIAEALEAGFRYKLIASVEKKNGSVSASVGLEKLPLSDPLAGVSGPVNAITFECDLLGETTIVGPGAGKIATGFALLNDLISLHKAAIPTA